MTHRTSHNRKPPGAPDGAAFARPGQRIVLPAYAAQSGGTSGKVPFPSRASSPPPDRPSSQARRACSGPAMTGAAGVISPASCTRPVLGRTSATRTAAGRLAPCSISAARAATGTGVRQGADRAYEVRCRGVELQQISTGDNRFHPRTTNLGTAWIPAAEYRRSSWPSAILSRSGRDKGDIRTAVVPRPDSMPRCR
jgi:hypothetical protein